MKKILILITVVTFLGCSQSNNSPESVVKKYLSGFISNEKKVIWEASNDAYLNSLLSQTEKDSSFSKFANNFDANKYTMFNKDISFNIKKTNKIYDTHVELLVEISFLSTNPYIINRYQSGKKILVKFSTKKIKSNWTVDEYKFDKILEYNKEYDKQKAIELLSKQVKKNVTTAMSTYRDIYSSYSDYFDNISSLKQIIEGAKKEVYEIEKQKINSGRYSSFISVYNVDYDNYDYGSFVKGTVKNNLATTITNVTVRAEFSTQSYSMSGYDCNSLKYSSKSFTKYINIGNLKPGQSKSFKEFYELRVSGKPQRGYCFHVGGQEGRIMGIKYGTLKVKPSSVSSKGTITIN